MQSDGKPSTILIKANPTRVEEIIAGGAFKPGHLLIINSAGKAVVHATSGGYGELLFAAEDALQGKTVTDAYASDEPANVLLGQSGDVVLARLGTSQDIVIGDKLMSDGDGTLAKLTSTNVVLAIALEAIDNDPGSGEVFIKVRLV
jgi:hypothetical protein